MLAKKALSATAGAPKLYVEDVMSCFLYTGNGSTQTITNGIDLSGEGGLVWIKDRDSGAKGHALFDTARGVNKKLQSQSTNGEFSGSNQLTAFNNNGFSLGSDSDPNGSGTTYTSWTFRKAKKFFDVVTYTGNGSAQTINHNLGSVPGCIIVKGTSSATQWWVFHRSIGNTDALKLNGTDATTSLSTFWNNTSPTSTQFTVGTSNSSNGVSYVAYLFAHDAGGFGDAGSDNIITCGSFTSDVSSNATVNLGWEPQWIIMKQSSDIAGWWMVNNMMPFIASPGTTTKYLSANLSDAEADWGSVMEPTATGFKGTGLGASRTYIYIAIRRGPMKTPTSGTEVYNAIARTGTGASTTVTGVGFAPDLAMSRGRSSSFQTVFHDRLRGATKYLQSASTSVENTLADGLTGFDVMDGVKFGADSIGYTNQVFNYINHFFRRAPGFFDVVCYTGTGANRTVSHGLGVTPELMIVKTRGPTVTNGDWAVYNTTNGNTKIMYLNATSASATSSVMWNNTSPTSSVFTVGTDNAVNYSGDNYVAYLFASVSGVSKVGSYTGNGSSVTVTTDFQPRFILVKRTDSTGDWIVSDSARGLVAGNDPYLKLNSTAAEVTNEDWVDISSTSFTVNQTTNNANVNTGTYIYLAIA